MIKTKKRVPRPFTAGHSLSIMSKKFFLLFILHNAAAISRRHYETVYNEQRLQ